MGQCVTVSIGNSGSVIPSETSTGGGTNVTIGDKEDDEEEEEEEEQEEGICGCLEEGNCFPCL